MTSEPTTPSEDAAPGEMDEREVDENLDGSFPASDPPAWTLGTDHITETDARRPAEDENE